MDYPHKNTAGKASKTHLKPILVQAFQEVDCVLLKDYQNSSPKAHYIKSGVCTVIEIPVTVWGTNTPHYSAACYMHHVWDYSEAPNRTIVMYYLDIGTGRSVWSYESHKIKMTQYRQLKFNTTLLKLQMTQIR